MPRRQPHSTRGVRVATMLCALVAAYCPRLATATEVDLVGWFSDAAAPALQAAAPTNDPLLASRELLNRGLAGGFTQMQRVGPPWLTRVRFDLSFDPTFQPRYGLAATHPLLVSARSDPAVDLHGRMIYDTAGVTRGDVGLRYQGRWHDHDMAVGVQGGVEDRWLQGLQRYSIGSEFRLSALEMRAQVHDDVPERPASRQIAERKLDGYDLEVRAPLPLVPRARLRASRSWQLAFNGEAVTVRDRLGLRPTPQSPLEIETGTQSQAEARSWFAQLRWRMKLGE